MCQTKDYRCFGRRFANGLLVEVRYRQRRAEHHFMMDFQSAMDKSRGQRGMRTVEPKSRHLINVTASKIGERDSCSASKLFTQRVVYCSNLIRGHGAYLNGECAVGLDKPDIESLQKQNDSCNASLLKDGYSIPFEELGIILMDKIKEAEKAIAERVKLSQKLHKRLSRARKQVESGKQLVSALENLAKDLQAFPPEPPLPDLKALADRANEEASRHAQKRERQFFQEIRELAGAYGLSVGPAGEGVTVGPFKLHINWKKEVASLEFARAEVQKGLPLVPKDLVSHIRQISQTELSPPSANSLPALAKELEEAIRVSVARRNSSLLGELRAELPAVYRELRFIKEGNTGVGGKHAQYSIARFVVEIKTLMQSDFNSSRPGRFRLETAVIENAKNAKKSMFIPNNLQKGYGEGTYFQAIILPAGG